ncbi:MAG: hypothetical protein AMXMBFR53_05540 [Gemmatimonadota bacterium]
MAALPLRVLRAPSIPPTAVRVGGTTLGAGRGLGHGGMGPEETTNPGTDARPADTRTVLPETATPPHPTTANGSGGSSDPGNRTNTESTEDKPKIEAVQGAGNREVGGG